jgi:hypothetical protein
MNSGACGNNRKNESSNLGREKGCYSIRILQSVLCSAIYLDSFESLRIKGFVSPKLRLRSRKTRFVAGFVFEKDAGMKQQCRGFQSKMNGIIALPINMAIEIVPTTIPNPEESIRISF